MQLPYTATFEEPGRIRSFRPRRVENSRCNLHGAALSWAFCLDKPCTIDKRDPTKASCECASVKRQRPYVIVTDAYTPKTCTTGIISSATVTQITQATDFLKKQR